MLRSRGLQEHSAGTDLTTMMTWKSRLRIHRETLETSWEKVLKRLVRALVLAEAFVSPGHLTYGGPRLTATGFGVGNTFPAKVQGQ